ncbi:type II toxin-antitoxin system mRNA interferase RelE [Georgenia halophila]|uniref:Type II toxin-antitoxin system mRNA interferase RelE n=1 Tax=Georgenia halophila TaxID=620889 RepID=A0ABP8L1Y1_9MICO
MAREPEERRVELAPAAIRALDRLPAKIAAAVVEFVTTTMSTNPRRMSKPLRPPLEEWRVARRGDYRVIIQLDDVAGVILVGRIEHRAHAYRRR